MKYDIAAIRENYKRKLEAFNAPPVHAGLHGHGCPCCGYEMREKPLTLSYVCCGCGYTIGADDETDYGYDTP